MPAPSFAHGLAPAARGCTQQGFTVIEMLVVMTAIALLLSVVAPVYVRHIDRARELTLKQDLQVMRDALDKFRADQARYPVNLQELVTYRYLRALPADPITDRADSWLSIASTDGGAPGVMDVHSGAPGKASDGSPYANW